MTRIDVAINDIAGALCSLKPDIPNRHATFVKSLEALVRRAIEWHEEDRVIGIGADMARVNEILQQSKNE